jgi:hypothetical protein
MPTETQIASMFSARKKRREPLLQAMTQVRQAYHGDLILPMPDMGKEEGSYVANLVQSGIDNIGARVASTVPQIDTYPVDPSSRASIRKARTRKRALLAWWERNELPRLMMARRARHLIAYGCNVMTVRYNSAKPWPVWEMRHPLETYPSDDLSPTDLTPRNVVFHRRVTREYLRGKGWPTPPGTTDQWGGQEKFDLLEYMDATEHVLCVSDPSTRTVTPIMRREHRVGRTPVVVSQRVSLDQPMGQFNQVVGMYGLQAKLMALELIAVEKGIFPDTYLVSRPGEQARYISGPYDGRSGRVNEIEGGDVKEIVSQPTYLATQMIDRLERAQRVTAGIPAEFGGESGSNIRTGRRGDAVLSAVIDMPIKEGQDALAAALEVENELAARVALAWMPDKQLTYIGDFGGRARSKKNLTFTPRQIFGETQVNRVTYPFSGSDIQGQTAIIGQMTGIGLLSTETARHLHPYIDDPESEKDLMQAETIERSLMAGVQQAAATGALPVPRLVQLWALVREDKKELGEAIQQINEEMLEEMKAQQAEQQQGQAPPGMPQPGAGGPLAGVNPMEPESQVQQPEPIRDMASLVTSLRKTSRPLISNRER